MPEPPPTPNSACCEGSGGADTHVAGQVEASSPEPADLLDLPAEPESLPLYVRASSTLT